jgi:hypothetical protein
VIDLAFTRVDCRQIGFGVPANLNRYPQPHYRYV